MFNKDLEKLQNKQTEMNNTINEMKNIDNKATFRLTFPLKFIKAVSFHDYQGIFPLGSKF